MGSLSLLQGIVPTQGSNPGLPHCRRIFYHKGSPRILEWIAYPVSSRSSQPRNRTRVSCIAGKTLPAEPQGKPKNTGVCNLPLLQQIFPTQESNQGLLHCRQILYSWATKEAVVNIILSLLFIYITLSKANRIKKYKRQFKCQFGRILVLETGNESKYYFN